MSLRNIAKIATKRRAGKKRERVQEGSTHEQQLPDTITPSGSTPRGPLPSSHPSLMVMDEPPVSMASRLELFVYVMGLDYHASPFGVTVERSGKVDDLKKAILKKNPGGLKGVGVAQLTLFHVVLLDAEDLEQRASQVEKKELRPTYKLSDVFPGDPPPMTVSILVQVQWTSKTTVPSKKRKLDCGASEYKNVNVAPSAFAKPSQFRRVMKGEGRQVYICNRPIDFFSAPVTLVSSVFGRLSDDVFSLERNLRSEDFAPARDLVNMLSELEENEGLRQEAFSRWLRETLHGRQPLDSPGGPQPTFARTIEGEGRSYTTDGYMEWNDCLLIVTEGKCELGDMSTDPDWQAMGYYRAYYMQKRCYYRVGQSCLPAVLIAYYGPYISASGAIMHPDGSVQVDALTPALRVDCNFRDDRQRNLLAQFVRALRNAFDGLMTFYASLESSHIPDPPGYQCYVCDPESELVSCWFPYKNSYMTGDGNTHTFQYKDILMQGYLVFVAEQEEREDTVKQIVVKFTRNYSTLMHDQLASCKLAPELLAAEELAGGWKMVVMEYLSGWAMFQSKCYEERLKCKERLERALHIIHEANYVHGDIRGPNILVSDDGDVKLIDFDHCGVHEQDRYPREWDHTHRPDDAKEGDLMRKEHDRWMFSKLFDRSVQRRRGFHFARAQ